MKFILFILILFEILEILISSIDNEFSLSNDSVKYLIGDSIANKSLNLRKLKPKWEIDAHSKLILVFEYEVK